MILLFAILTLSQMGVLQEYRPDADCQEFGDGSTMAMSECLKAQSETWERRLTIEYSAALARAEIGGTALRRSQKQWLRYRDVNCAAYNTVQGTIHTILSGRCWRDMTRARTLELKEMDWTG